MNKNKHKKHQKDIETEVKNTILTQKQQEIVKKVIQWYYINSYNKTYFSIGGVAGS